MRTIQVTVKRVIFSKFYHFLTIPFLALVFDQIDVLNNPERSAINTIQRRGVYHYLRYFMEQLYFFEIITFVILAVLIKYYSRWFRLRIVNTGLKSLLIYELKWLPLFLVSIFIFGPVTNFFRYLVMFYPVHGWELYFPEFLMSVSMYLNYLVPVVIWGYVIVNINLVVSYIDIIKVMERQDTIHNLELKLQGSETVSDSAQAHAFTKLSPQDYLSVIEGTTIKGAKLLTVGDILWFEVQNRSYYAHLNEVVYAVKKTIAELEKELDPRCFFRINRSQIINLHVINSYNYWEFEKYLIRLNGVEDKEFVITRKRFKELKEELESVKKETSKR